MLPLSKLRTIVRRRTIAQVKKGMKDLERQGYVPVMAEPVLEPRNPYSMTPDSYVMVMEHPTKTNLGSKQW